MPSNNYFGPEEPAYPHLSRGRVERDLRGDINRGFVRAQADVEASRVMHSPVADATALEAVPASERLQGIVALVEDVGLFKFNTLSIEAAVAGDVVVPSDITAPAPGRWLRYTANADAAWTTFSNAPGALFYADSVNGDAGNPGTLALPKAAANDAVALAIAYQAANPTSTVEVRLRSGSYAEDLTLEDLDLKRIVIRADGGRVIVNSLQSTTDNRNLAYLRVVGIEFLNASELSCPTTGATNLFLSHGALLSGEFSRLEDCKFSGRLTILSAHDLLLPNTFLAAGITVKNCVNVELISDEQDRIWIEGACEVSFDTALPVPGVEGSTYFSQSVNMAGIQCSWGTSLTMTNNTAGSTGNSVVFLEKVLWYGTMSLNKSNIVVKGIDVVIYFTGASSLSNAAGLYIYNGTLTASESLTVDGTSFFSLSNGGLRPWMKVVPDIDSPGAVVDKFHKDLGNRVKWEYLVHNADYSIMRSGTVTVLYNGTVVSTVADDVMNQVGDSSDVTFSAAYNGLALELTAVASSDNWGFRARGNIV